MLQNALNWVLDRIAPFTVFTSSPFCDLKVGEYFQERDGLYRLIERNAIRVRVVKVNWWTKLWWGGVIRG